MAINHQIFQQLILVLEKLMPLSLLFKKTLMDMVFEEHLKKGTRILYQREIQKKTLVYR